MTTVKYGSSGADVRRLSILLGLDPRTKCDQEMLDAILGFQRAWGLTADGIFGYKSWKKILIMDRYSNNQDGKIVLSDYDLFAWLLDCEPEMIRAFVQVESSGSGFLGSGRPRILFESYQFYKNLISLGIDPEKYIKDNSDIITKTWVKNYVGGEREWIRLEKARKINKDAANMSASWGLLQILGSNYKLCDKNNVSEFVNDMSKDEFTQLSLGIDFLKNSRLTPYLISKDFKTLAKLYNGPSYAANKYDIKLKAAYYSIKKG